MPLEIFAADEQDAEPVDTLRWVELATSVLDAEGVKGDTELSLLFVDEAAMAELNQRYLGRNGPTDVLAFPLDGDDVVASARATDSSGPGPVLEPEPDDVPGILGDVVLCPAVARRHADERKRGYDDEMALLIVHGILHLLGMDHVEDKDAVVMERRERELLQRYHDPKPEAGR
ncbi:MAG: rRNA maturation RNase YbeY [Actinomycetota bacterium]|nr:rRNA maturation RNase YbeY [Actinomycetota bacterium]